MRIILPRCIHIQYDVYPCKSLYVCARPRMYKIWKIKPGEHRFMLSQTQLSMSTSNLDFVESRMFIVFGRHFLCFYSI